MHKQKKTNKSKLKKLKIKDANGGIFNVTGTVLEEREITGIEITDKIAGEFELLLQNFEFSCEIDGFNLAHDGYNIEYDQTSDFRFESYDIELLSVKDQKINKFLKDYGLHESISIDINDGNFKDAFYEAFEEKFSTALDKEMRKFYNKYYKKVSNIFSYNDFLEAVL